MRTRNTFTSNEVLNTQEKPLAKAVRTALDTFSKRELNLVDNPLAEYWNEVLDILNLDNTTKSEETSYRLWKTFWVSSTKLREIIERDRMDEQVLKMLAQVWLKELDLSKNVSSREKFDFQLFAR